MIDGRNRPLLLRLKHVGRHAGIDRTDGPVASDLRGVLIWNRRWRRRVAASGGCAAAARPAAASRAADRHTLHRHLERRSGARRLDFVGAGRQVLTGDRPAVAPQQRTNVEHADAAAIEVRFVVAGKLLHAVAEIQQPEMSHADVPAARSGEELAAALEHVDAHVVDERARHLSRSSRADVVARVAAGTARSMRHQQVVPPFVKDHHRGFGVDRDVGRLGLGMQPFPGLWIQLDEADVAEIQAVGEPHRAVRRIAHHAGIDRVAVLDAVRPDDRAAVFPLVIRRRRVERAAHEQTHGRLRLRSGRSVIEEVLVAGADDIGRPAVVAASRDHVGPGFAARHGPHDRAAPVPRPPVV